MNHNIYEKEFNKKTITQTVREKPLLSELGHSLCIMFLGLKFLSLIIGFEFSKRSACSFYISNVSQFKIHVYICIACP